MNITTLTHPEYDSNISNWEKYRNTYSGGKDFVNNYVKKFSTRESDADFTSRKEISYCPAYAKSAVNDIKNSIYQRMVDIVRTGGPLTYQLAIKGENGGVDNSGNTMNSFIGRIILPELLSIGKVGVFIDKPNEAPLLKSDARNFRPYIYHYTAESIRSWTYDKNNQLTALLLQDNDYAIDDETGLTTDTVETYRLFNLVDGIVNYTIFDSKSNILSNGFLNLPVIPFVVFGLSDSLLKDTADYQIACANLASSDINYALKSNFPFYTEQFKPGVDMPGIKSSTTDGQEETIKTGVSQGRRYPAGLERPGFIHPSSEPLLASMEKQKVLEQDIKKLVNLAVANVTSASAESKEMDQKGLEAGLSYIGLELEYGERKLANIWSLYEGDKNAIVIKYPDNYQIKSDADRVTESKELRELSPTIPSITFQKYIAKNIANIILGSKVTKEEIDKIYNEIDSNEIVITDPETIRADHESGFLGTNLASKLRGYPIGEVEKAKVDHAERLARIAIAQTQGVASGAARGITDLDTGDGSAKNEKTMSQSSDTSDTGAKKVRGKENG